MQKTCKSCGEDFEVPKNAISFYERANSETPSFCSDCRNQNRMNWRNERSLHKRSCDLCKKNIITIYSPEKPFRVYCNDCFHGDGWDPMSYGLDIDFSKPFLAQWRELQLKVPRLYAFVFKNYNSDYTNGSAFNKNCYLIFVSDHNEDSLYSHSIFACKNTVDTLNSSECEFCYDSTTCKKSYRVFSSEDCSNSQDLYFCKNCVNCHDCIGSANLRNQQYCIWNVQYSKEDYLIEKEKLTLKECKHVIAVKEKAKEFWQKFPVKYIHGLQNVDVTGDYIFNSKNTDNSYESDLLEDSNFITYGNKSKNCIDGYVVVDNCEFSHEIVSGISLNNCHSCYGVWHGFDIYYSDTCENSDHLFGCIGLKKKKYCILNKQYTKEEYEGLVPKIIAHMKQMPYRDSRGQDFTFGDFFPNEFSPFSYNETAALENFPLNKAEASDLGYSWHEKEQRNYDIDIKAENLPESIDDVNEEILNKVITCLHHEKNTHGKASCEAVCTEAFKITAEELQFYKRFELPIPRICPNCRHYTRLKNKNPRQLWPRKCMKENCQKKFETSYSPDSLEIVYCDKCYQLEVY